MPLKALLLRLSSEMSENKTALSVLTKSVLLMKAFIETLLKAYSRTIICLHTVARVGNDQLGDRKCQF